MVRVTRAAYAEAFPAVTGRPLIKLPQTAGRSESEIFFDALALNGVSLREADEAAESEQLLAPFTAELATSLAARRDLAVGLALAASWLAVWGLYSAYYWPGRARRGVRRQP